MGIELLNKEIIPSLSFLTLSLSHTQWYILKFRSETRWRGKAPLTFRKPQFPCEWDIQYSLKDGQCFAWVHGQDPEWITWNKSYRCQPNILLGWDVRTGKTSMLIFFPHCHWAGQEGQSGLYWNRGVFTFAASLYHFPVPLVTTSRFEDSPVVLEKHENKHPILNRQSNC